MQKIKEDEFVFPFEKLEVWQHAVDLADFILNLMESFPANKYYKLIGQMEAAVSSVAQNIAEGGEKAEIRTIAETIDRKLHGLINSLRGRR